MRTAGSAISVLAAAALLASCGAPSSNEHAADVAVTQTQAAARGPAPSADSAAKVAPVATAAPILTPDGLTSLRIGMSLAEVTAAMGPDADPDAVGGANPAQCDQFRPARAPQGVLAMMENGRLTRISLINRNSIKTDRGVGIGSTAAEVRSAYGGAAVASPHKYRDAPAEYLTVWSRKALGGDRTTPADRGIVFEVDQKGVVDLIHAGGPSIQYVEGCL